MLRLLAPGAEDKVYKTCAPPLSTINPELSLSLTHSPKFGRRRSKVEDLGLWAFRVFGCWGSRGLMDLTRLRA